LQEKDYQYFIKTDVSANINSVSNIKVFLPGNSEKTVNIKVHGKRKSKQNFINVYLLNEVGVVIDSHKFFISTLRKEVIEVNQTRINRKLEEFRLSLEEEYQNFIKENEKKEKIDPSDTFMNVMKYFILIAIIVLISFLLFRYLKKHKKSDKNSKIEEKTYSEENSKNKTNTIICNSIEK
jgi:hypothetical protein